MPPKMPVPKPAPRARNCARERFGDRYKDMTKAELIRLLEALEARRKLESNDLARVVHDLEVHQRQLQAQNHDLLEIQQQLEHSRDRYAQLYEFSPVGYLGIDETGCVWVLNLTAAAILGSERTRRTGAPLAQYIEESDRSRFHSHLQQCRSGVAEVKTELRLNTANGVREIELLSAGMTDGEGRGALYRTALTDITETRRAAAALRDSEAKLRWLIDNMPAVLWISDHNGSPRYMSSNIVRVLGYTEHEVRSGGTRFWFNNIHPDDRARVHVAYVQLFSAWEDSGTAAYDIEYRRQAKDGSWIWVVDQGMSVSEQDGVRYATGMFWDSSRRKRMQEQLRESEERFRQLAENINDVFFLTDVSGNQIFYVSPAFERIWGFSVAKLYREPQSWRELVHVADRERVRRAFQARRPGNPYDMEFRILRPNGAVRWIRARGFPIRDAFGRAHRVAGIAVDITVRKEAAAAQEQANQRLREFGVYLEAAREDERIRIAREIHDDLGAMLLAIKIDLDACRKEHAALPRVAGTMKDAMGRIDEAVNAVRRISTALRPSVLDNIGVVAAVEWQAQELERRTGIGCDVTCESDHDELDIDPERATAIFRIVQEALTNVARHSEATRVNIILRDHAGTVELQIRDNGKGFDAGRATDFLRWGLIGLGERVRAFGGKFAVTTAPRQGTAIKVLIPPPDAVADRVGRKRTPIVGFSR
jgi:two-component system sensor histidine kinase UhpB